jgi:hypothetical protein
MSGRVFVHHRGHGAAIARLFCGHYAATESFAYEGVGRALG